MILGRAESGGLSAPHSRGYLNKKGDARVET